MKTPFPSHLPKAVRILILCLLPLIAQAQENPKQHPTDYFRLPMNREVSLAGDFAEIRSNHFHSGLDLRTGGKTGEAIYAPADGYISRINISAWGGGKVLYITHPNGYRTAFMHLDAFCGDIAKFVHDYQYEHQVFAFDIDLPVDSFKVVKGQLVARSGNTGGSMGPHLHYDIRYAHNDQAINPLYFGIKYTDPVAPTIVNIKVYPADNRTAIEGQNRELYLNESRKQGKKTVTVKRDTITVSGRFYTGIYTYDQMEAGSSKNGVEEIELYVDGQRFWRYCVPTFLFEETRAINAVIDYPQYRKNREYYILTRCLRGNRNTFSVAERDNGYLEFSDEALHRLEYRVSDYKGNTTRRTFFVRSRPSGLLPDTDLHNIELAGKAVSYFRQFRLSEEGFVVELQPWTVYEHDYLTHSLTTDRRFLTPLHTIGLKKYPLPPHQPFTVKLLIPNTIPSPLRARLTVVNVEGKSRTALATKIAGDWAIAASRSFGGFALELDTVSPTVKPANFADGKALTAASFSVKISDNLSGVASYACHVNGQWELAEHDGKSSSLTVDAAVLKKGRNEVVFKVVDAVGNSTEEHYTILRN